MTKLKLEDLSEQDFDLYDSITIEAPEKKLEILKTLIAKYPNFVQARLNLALTYLSMDNIKDSRRIYKEVLADFPVDKGAIAGMSMVYAAEQNYDKAEELAQQALDNGYEWAPCYEVIAEAKESKGDMTGAAEAYLKGYQLSPHSWRCLEKYCLLTKHPFHSPLDDEMAMPVSEEEFQDLIAHLQKLEICDHTLKSSTEWAKQNNVDVINLYQFLNYHGGYCDCEVLMNVVASLYDDDDDIDSINDVEEVDEVDEVEEVEEVEDEEEVFGLGFHLALSKDQEKELLSLKDVEDLLDFIQEQTEDEDEEWYIFCDTAWDAIHRCLTDGRLSRDNGDYPLNTCIMGGKKLSQDDNVIVTFLDANNVEDLAKAFNKIDRNHMQSKYNAIDADDYILDKSEEDFDFVWDMFLDVRELLNKAADAKRAVFFSVVEALA